jgi:uncharacterized membrane protein
MANPNSETIDVNVEVGSTTVEPPFVQRAGLRLALGVGTLIALVTLVLVAFLWKTYPSPPDPDYIRDPVRAKAVIENFKILADLAVKNAVDLFHTIVTQALLPVFTAILGYIFAKSGRDER